MIENDALDTSQGLLSEKNNASSSPKAMYIKSLELRHNAQQRENRRIRNSASFRFGLLCSKAIKRPWNLFLLPLTIPYLIFSIGMERLGKWPIPYSEISSKAQLEQPVKDSIVLFPTNGVGFGHFTRMYALARRFKAHSPETEIIFFTTMPTLHLLYNEGFSTYHVAGRKKFKSLSASDWNALVEEHLSLVFNHHRPKMFMFDGAFPYRGMLNAIRDQTQIEKVWMRRGTFKKGSNVPVDSIEHFDLIVHPEDSVPLAMTEVHHSVASITCPPIVLLDEEDLLSREQARYRLNVPIEGRVVYVQLGAGRINDIDSEVRITVDALLLHNDVTIVLGESMLGERLSFEMDRVVVIRDYPNSMYFNAFDATVQAGGYNSFHETRRFGLPALFYPNMETGVDDQYARCMVAENEGWGVVILERNEISIRSGIEEILKLEITHQKNNEKSGAFTLYQSLTAP